MQTQHFDVGDNQTRAFNCRCYFRQRRNIAPREHVFSYEGVGDARWLGAADGVDQCDAIFAQQRTDFAEECQVMIDADMLEHSDRHDAVVLPALFAIVAQVEPDPIG